MDFKVSKRYWLLAGLLGAAFLAYVIFPFLSPPLFNSPDENINLLLVHRLANGQSLIIDEPLEAITHGHLTPRSLKARGDYLVPVGFVGLPVFYGFLFKLLPLALTVFTTPVLATVGVLMWYLIIKRFFTATLAIWAAVLLAFHPAYWYYASRGLLPNVPFLVLVLSAMYLLSRQTSNRWRVWLTTLAGALTGLALWMRLVEILWVWPLFLLILVSVYRHRFLRQLLIFGAGFTVVGCLAALAQHSLYGSALAVGYGDPVQVAKLSQAQGFWAWHELDMLRRFWSWGVALLPLSSILTLIGLAVFWRQSKTNRVARLAIGLFLGLVFVLILMYGGWNFQDNGVLSGATIGSSYIRYWLPVFVASTLFAGRVLEYCWQKFQSGWQRVGWVTLAMVYVVVSGWAVYFQYADSLKPTLRNLQRYAAVKTEVLARTPPQAVLVVSTTDKIFFPERRVIVDLTNSGVHEALRALEGKVPLYYFGSELKSTDRAYLEDRILSGVAIELVQDFDTESLYRLNFDKK